MKECLRCSKDITGTHHKRLYCDECIPLKNKNYQGAYQKDYRQSGSIYNENKRSYFRKGMNSLSDADYCKKNYNTISGCLECPVKTCLQPEGADEFLIWEQEGFNEERFLR